MVNFNPGEDVANAVDIGLGAGGTVQVQPFVPVHLVVDVYGYFTGGELAGSNTALGDSALGSTTLTGTNNTALGASALLNNTTGNGNTALGDSALTSNTMGNTNTAQGAGALFSNTTGSDNTALGFTALSSNTTGGNNTALGVSALFDNTTGNGNVAIGIGAGDNVTTGDSNIAIGFQAGENVTAGSSNIHIGNVGDALDTPNSSASAPWASKRAPSSPGSSARSRGRWIPVLVNNFGQLGTASSSRRVKDEIRGMDEASAGLGKLRPVVFRYKAELANGPRPLEYGLIAEEVAEIYPELVVLDKDGQPSGVRYHALPAMLLNELQRQQRVIETQAAQAREQARLIDELTARLSRLEAMGTAAAGR